MRHRERERWGRVEEKKGKGEKGGKGREGERTLNT